MIIALPLARYQFDFQVEKPFVLRHYAGSLLRGLFGHSLKKLLCLTGKSDCESCLMWQNCNYPAIFAPPPKAHKIQNFSQIPPPYLVQADTVAQKSYQSGDQLVFSQVLAGSALQQLSLIILAWQRALQGNITKSGGSAILRQVAYCDPNHQTPVIVYQNDDKLRPHQALYSFHTEHNANAQDEIQIQLQTPLRVQKHSRVVGPEKLRARDFLVSLLRRIELINTFYLHQPLFDDIMKYIHIAENFSLQTDPDQPLIWQDWARYSNRQRQKIQLGGITGNFILRGDIAPLLAYLKLGEYLHVGKNTVFGLGKYRISG